MTTSLTDARYNSLHFTSLQLIALDIDPDPETGWGVMPGYDQTIPIPAHLEPPMTDADETLPSHMHPSYPFGRPVTRGQVRVGQGKRKEAGGGIGNLLGTLEAEPGGSGGGGSGGGGWAGRVGWGDEWTETGIREVLELEKKREVPPGMAGAKRPPSPPSPSLHPTSDPQPRSEHLRNLLARQRQVTPAQAEDPFDAPLPNELYQEGEEGHIEQQGQRQGQVGSQVQMGEAEGEE